MAITHGETITRAEANKYFSRAIKIRKKHGQNLRQVLKDDPEAERFYCGRNGQDSENEDYAYFFDKESWNRLKALVDASSSDGLVIFIGTRNDQPPQNGESNGRPTLLLFPAKLDDRKYIIANKGEEHPGTGGGKPLIKDMDDEYTIPDIEEVNIHKLLP